MIRIYRGDELDALADAREEQLSRIALRGRPPTEAEFVGYKVNAAALLARQFYKCGYCEMDVREQALPIEHYRPKGEASRIDWQRLAPPKAVDGVSRCDDQRFAQGLPPTNRDRVKWTDHDGYWWLAWTWENHVMACGACNTGLKTTRFPLRNGSAVLSAHQQPPGGELPLLLDPTATDPMAHIVFEDQNGRWQAFPRDDSPEGDWTIHVFHLNSPDLLGKYKRRVAELSSHTRTLNQVIARNAPVADIAAEGNSLCALVLAPEQPFLALTHDWLDAQYPSAMRAAWSVPPLQHPELCLAGVSRLPQVRAVLPPRAELARFSPELQHLIRVARHHRSHADTAPRVDQLPLRTLIARMRAEDASLTQSDAAAMVARSVQRVRESW